AHLLSKGSKGRVGKVFFLPTILIRKGKNSEIEAKVFLKKKLSPRNQYNHNRIMGKRPFL
ncbi:hypothetical protein QUF54_04255, partial [Candidatus Marithioploca araucensis]|nr:hypothetical protein [Candidatus Marithioploca araucensis]